MRYTSRPFDVVTAVAEMRNGVVDVVIAGNDQ
jgi:hypothetical protein